MEDISYLDLSNYAGLLATCVLTLNILLGMMISTGYSGKIYWKKLPVYLRKWDIVQIHNWTAYIALALVVLHPVLLVADRTSKFTWADVLFPVHPPHERLMVVFGTLSLYALLVVIISTQKAVKRSLGFKTWKAIHLISYITALLFLVHGMIIDPSLKDRPADLIDAEKMLSEGCLLLIIIATIARYRYHLHRQPVNNK